MPRHTHGSPPSAPLPDNPSRHLWKHHVVIAAAARRGSAAVRSEAGRRRTYTPLQRTSGGYRRPTALVPARCVGGARAGGRDLPRAGRHHAG
eukprot:scaffold91366_cov27-Tisochrysis_lutea.AAC.3